MTASNTSLITKIKSRGIRRLTARFALFFGAIASFGFMLWSIYYDDSVTRLVMYSLWVMSPFFALFFTKFMIQKRVVLSNKLLYNVMIIVSTLAILIYLINAISPLSETAEFVFQMVPLALWVIILIVLINAALKSRKKKVES